MALKPDAMSNLYRMICDTCGHETFIDSDSGVGAAALAAASGWSLGLSDQCRDCASQMPTKRARSA